MDKLDRMTSETAMADDACNKLRAQCRNLRQAIQRSGCGGRADPLLCQPMWDELNAVYEALHDCNHPPKKR